MEKEVSSLGFEKWGRDGLEGLSRGRGKRKRKGVILELEKKAKGKIRERKEKEVLEGKQEEKKEMVDFRIRNP